MGQPAARQGDRIVAIDMHLIQPPGPTSPVPVPHPVQRHHRRRREHRREHRRRGGGDGGQHRHQHAAAHSDRRHVREPADQPRDHHRPAARRCTINGKPAARAGDTARTCNDPVDLPVGTVVAVGTGAHRWLSVDVAASSGRGWAFPVVAGPRRTASRFVAGEDAIEQAIEIILGTSPGERVMRPEFGCGIWELVMEPNTAQLHGRVQARVREALVRWEPRIDVLDVRVESPPEQKHVLLIRHRLPRARQQRLLQPRVSLLPARRRAAIGAWHAARAEGADVRPTVRGDLPRAAVADPALQPAVDQLQRQRSGHHAAAAVRAGWPR